MFSGIRIYNFRCLKDVNIECRPLTIFVGKNGSGKSSLLDALLFLKQGLEKSPLLAFKGSLADFGMFKDLIYGKESFGWISIGLKVKPTTEEIDFLLKSAPDFLSLHFTPEDTIGYQLQFRDEEVMQTALKNDAKLIGVGDIKSEEKSGPQALIPKGFAPISSVGNILHKATFYIISSDGKKIPELFSEEFTGIFQKKINKLYYLSTTRGKIPIEERATTEFSRLKEENKEWVGSKGEYLIEMLSMIYGSRILREIREKIIYWAEEFGISDLEAGWIGKEAIFSSDFMDPKTKIISKLAFAGYGTRQILSVIVQLFYSAPGSIILIEEPEISLHIESQHKLLRLFSAAISEGKQIFITTHSEHILLALRSLIAEGEISAEDIVIYHFEKGPEGTKDTRLNLTTEGIIKGWVPSYVETEKNLLNLYLKTLPEE